MNAEETIIHLLDMGALNKVEYSAKGNPLLILASAHGNPGYAIRCMKDFKDSEGYYEGASGIDAITTDGVRIVMSF